MIEQSYQATPLAPLTSSPSGVHERVNERPKRSKLARTLVAGQTAAERRKPKNGKKWHGGKWCNAPKRFAIYLRDGFRCVYCGAHPGAYPETTGRGLSLDHVVPETRGGTHAAENLVTACKPCNTARHNRTMREWLRYLREKGVDTTGIAARIRRLTKKKLDRVEGRRLAKEAKRRS